jgi:hypothetical protein
MIEPAQFAHAIRLVATEVDRLRYDMGREWLRAVRKEAHVQQLSRMERDMMGVLTPLMAREMDDLADGLDQLSVDAERARWGVCIVANYAPEYWVGRLRKESTDDLMEQARMLVDADWHANMLEGLLPVFVKHMVDAGRIQMDLLDYDWGKSNKTSRAEELLQNEPDLRDEMDALMDGAGYSGAFISEYPDWMKASISKQLSDSFSQPYWQNVHATTQGDATRFLRQGLRDGWSIREISGGLRQYYGGNSNLRYARARAENIARTESGNALNGSHRAVIDGINEELGPESQIRLVSVWLSVLGNTTRPSHAALHLVREDAEGMFTLSGYRIPWPSHTSLPPGERCNCQCSIISEPAVEEE